MLQHLLLLATAMAPVQNAATAAASAAQAVPHALIHLAPIDIAILAVYLVFVIAIGYITGKGHQTSEDFFLSGRSIPAWITGLAFISANLGALEVMGMATSGYQYGMMTANYYWVGAIPAMVFMGVAMMPFFYGSKVRSVPEFLKKRYNEGARFINAITFAVFTPAISGISMYAMAVVLQDFLGWHFWPSVVVSGLVVLVYTFLGGLTASIYNEVLQFFLIVLGVAPLTIIGLIANHAKAVKHAAAGMHESWLAAATAGWGDFTHWLDTHQVSQGKTMLPGSMWLHTWMGTGHAAGNTLQITWPGVVLGLGFVLSFSYWCTNFLVVQRALAAKDMNSAQRTPLLAAFPKMLFPFIVILPGILAIPLLPHLVTGGTVVHGKLVSDTHTVNNVMPLMMGTYYPAGLLGLGLTALMASFMSGMAGNVTAFNTVVTYDLYGSLINPNASDKHYLWFGRIMTILGVAISVGFAFWVRGANSIMGYTQTIFGVVNAPLIAVFLLGMFWPRTTPWGGFIGLLVGTGTSVTLWILCMKGHPMAHFYKHGTTSAFWNALWSFCAGASSTILVSLFTRKQPVEQLTGLVYQVTPRGEVSATLAWYRKPLVLGILALLATLILNLLFW